MPDLPNGTVTFLFTDIEGSSRLWEEQPDGMRVALERHDALLHYTIETNGGLIFKVVGDAFYAAFPTAPEALEAALAAQQSLQQAAGVVSESYSLRVRMALHTGSAELRQGDYFGQPLNRVARLLSAGHGGQVLASAATQELVRDHLPSDAALKDLGSHRLRDLSRPEEIYQLLHPELRSEFPPLKALDALPNNLPQQSTSFVGREKELSDLRDLMGKTRLLTLTGSGGAGKTRLMLQLGADLLEEYSDGVWLVELAALTDPALVPEAVAAVLGLKEEPGKSVTDTLQQSLKDKELLLLLDNCEHLLQACADVSNRLLSSCPGVNILASSREGLNIPGEQSYRVPSLSVPDPKQSVRLEELRQYEAVKLFIERACSHQPSFSVTNENALAVAELCHRLDGIPMAIELAAARIKAMPVEQIARRLDDRFRLLTGGSRTALPRQQTLRALIDWSYDLLQEHEKALMSRLSVFVGSWTLAIAEQVCSGEGIEEWEVLDLVTSLVSKSLVHYEQQPGEGRYRLPETVRQYARDRLMDGGNAGWFRDRHLESYLEQTESAVAAGPEGYMDILGLNRDNLRAALDWATLDERRAELGIRLCLALQLFWFMGMELHEGKEWIQRALAISAGAPASLRARALASAGELELANGSLHTATQRLEKSVELARESGDRDLLAWALKCLGAVMMGRGQPAAAGALLEEARRLCLEIDSITTEGWCAGELGYLAALQGNARLAQSLHEESLALFRRAKDRIGEGSALTELGRVLARQGDARAGRALVEQGLAIRRELGDMRGVWFSLTVLADVAELDRDIPAARALLETILEMPPPGDVQEHVLSLCKIGDNLTALGDLTGAEMALHAAISLSQSHSDRPLLDVCLIELGHVQLARGDLEVARSNYEQGLRLREDCGKRFWIGYSLLETGHVAWLQQDYPAAKEYTHRAMKIGRENNNPELLLNALESLGSLGWGAGQPTRAARLLGASESLRELLNQPPSTYWTVPRNRILAATHGLKESESAAWVEGRSMTLDRAVALALKSDNEAEKSKS